MENIGFEAKIALSTDSSRIITNYRLFHLRRIKFDDQTTEGTSILQHVNLISKDKGREPRVPTFDTLTPLSLSGTVSEDEHY